VINRKTGKAYAMKNIRKNVVIDSESFDSIRLEKFIMLSVDHPFIIGMEYVFQTEYRIYFMMEFIKGGELY
jgi:serine/threonine protein kinase